MHFIKKNIIIPLVVFIIGMSAVAGIVCSINNEQNKQNRTMANLNAMTYAERMKTDIMKGIGVSDTLRQIIISDDGQLNKFYEIAEEMMTDSVQSIQIAPGGVVTDIYPQEGNDAGKIDLLNDKNRGEICRYGRDNKVVTMQGPFQLKQGEYGIAVRKPVYIEENGHEDFWGFTIVIIRVPEIFADSMKALSDFGYNYTLYKTAFTTYLSSTMLFWSFPLYFSNDVLTLINPYPCFSGSSYLLLIFANVFSIFITIMPIE